MRVGLNPLTWRGHHSWPGRNLVLVATMAWAAISSAQVLANETGAAPAEVEAASVQPSQDATGRGGGSSAVSISTRNQTAPSPVKAQLTFSQFTDIPVSGDADDVLRYGGKIDGYFDIKGSAWGMDDSLSLHVHPEFKYGESANGTVGLLPSNTQLFYPGEGEVFDLSINLTKRWRSGASLTVGKINILDIAEHLPVEGGGGHEGFMNLAMALPPSAIVPGSIIGAQLTVPTKKALYRLWVFDPELQSKKTGFESPFDKGVAFLSSVTVPVKIGGKQGYYALKVAGSTRSMLATEALPAALVPAPGSSFGYRKGELSVVLAGYQFIQQYADHPGKGWGLFGQVYVSNGDPTFLDKSGFIGVSGNPHFRPQDRFGIAWFRYSLTNGLVGTLSGRLALEDEEGVEAFYTVGLNKYLRLTGDVQVVDSAIAARSTGVIAGMRLTAKY